MRSRSMVGVVAVGCVILLPSCGTEPDAGQQPGPLGSTAPAASPIPPVQNPRDVAAMADRPCDLLSPQQAAEFGLGLNPSQVNGTLGNVDCVWLSSARDRRMQLSTFTDNSTLEAVYSRRTSFASFELTAVTEYPATVTRSNADLPVCSVDVKLAERQSVTVTYRSDEFDNDPQQACVVGKQVAEAVVMNLPPKT